MRRLLLFTVLACAACADSHALPYTAAGDPVWPLNAGRWNASPNDLTAPPDAPPPVVSTVSAGAR